MKLMNKSSLLGFAMIATLNCSCAMAEVIQEEQQTVYTDGFKMVDSSVNTDANVLGTVGEYTVVEGTKDPNHIAYVKPKNNRSYVINNTIIVKCRSTDDCIPAIYDHTRIGKGKLFKVKVNDYTQWQQAVEDLAPSDSIAKMSPSYDYGVKMRLM